ncbi:MAG TPA: amidohydrolase family protein [Solirubrobacteraceae bacterium]|nr:amidohydrolase family protein [Solirubrobacteraceae bacterium]
MSPAIDTHQHLWPEPLLSALSQRREPPMLVRRGAGWALRLLGEPEGPVDLADHDPDARAALVRADGLDRALVVPSTPLGIEALSPGEAETLLAAYHEGVRALPDEFGAWAAVGLADPDPVELARLLDAGFVGACVGAEALAGPDGLERLGPVLETLERRGAPLLVHPGPAPATSTAGLPDWWAALTGYVATMQTAWHAFAVWGRVAHPGLRVCFAMLAGLAPLQRERLVARGGPAISDPDIFLDVSSYGARTVDAVLREVGVDRLVHGSDRPVVTAAELPLGDAVRTALRQRNPARLLSTATTEVHA